jgi:SlyX protein
MMMDEDRLIDIEIKLARADDMLDELNKVVYAQQKKIETLEALYTAILRRLPEASSDHGGGVLPHEKPPHY